MALSDARLIYVAERYGAGGVGDYAELFVNAITPRFGEVSQYRVGGPGEDTVADVRRHRAAVRELLADSPAGRTIVHAELSGGSVAPFWAVAGLRDVLVTATVHDPPNLIWWPARTKFLAHHRIINHGLHYPLQAVSHRIQRRAANGRVLFALTDSGVASLRGHYPAAQAVRVPHISPGRTEVLPVTERPRAVGFFGLVYRGKGFEQIAAIRRRLPADIGIRVAGRGTESLPAEPGIDIVGGVDGAEEDAFFASVRAIVVPYGRRTFYGPAYPSSGVVAHAIAYGTPVICSDHGALADLDESVGAVVLRGPMSREVSAERFADEIAALVDDGPRLGWLDARVRDERAARRPQPVADAFVAQWSSMLGVPT